MPHYRDGTEAQVGDFAVGKPYNTPGSIVGRVMQITPNTNSCNLQIAWVEPFDLRSAYGPVGGLIAYEGVVPHQKKVLLVPRVDHGAIGDFILVHREGMEHAADERADVAA